jgi:DNA-binding CsgD family transcriptional regulator
MTAHSLFPQSPGAANRTSHLTWFEPLLAQLARSTSKVIQRQEGVAFLKAAKDLYVLDCLVYLCVNIPRLGTQKEYTHCLYTDDRAMQCFTAKLLGPEILQCAGLDPDLFGTTRDWSQNPSKSPVSCCESHDFTLALRARAGETAFIGLTAGVDPSQVETKPKPFLQELGILGNYFHGHILRINGCDSEADILMTAKELDCLKWTAAGKTAWEASIILGISERTVRFHLNMAREKLNCTTTTQAVAKAVANHLISV